MYDQIVEVTANVTVAIVDVNNDPQCILTPIPIQATANLIDPVGTIIGTVVCWDYDVNPSYVSILYQVDGALNNSK